ncbi:Rhs element Vgr protein [Roseateles amylovorans]|uniref:Rhs element Vgr protein n=1 Tax=Roseateles amylovorans TaxID=2978473 RepID=A0ABY6ASA5_9BURK|nr:Rhs element Vgr protein [Roseateles amylovorans]UXH76121.1 Rhs element Vgr protein [Roseateles amylovorans]
MPHFVIPGPIGLDSYRSSRATHDGATASARPAGLQVKDWATHLHATVGPLNIANLPATLPALTRLTPVGEKRPLSVGEIEICRKVFQAAVDYDKVWIHCHEFLPFDLQDDDTAMTPNGEIYFNYKNFKEDFSKSTAGDQWWFVHEMTHVWQHQLGYWVMMRGAIRIGLSYKYELKKGKTLGDFNMEAQGNLIADYFVLKHLGKPNAMANGNHQNDLALFEEVLSDFLKDPSDHANLP